MANSRKQYCSQGLFDPFRNTFALLYNGPKLPRKTVYQATGGKGVIQIKKQK